MVDFLKPIPAEAQLADNTGRSKGFSTGAAGAAFEGAGRALQLTTGVLDKGIQDKIKKDAYQLFDESMTGFVDVEAPARASVVNSGGEVPTGAEKSLSDLQRVSVAYSQGRIPESYYRSVLMSRVKDLRARYPGYREQVDTAVRSITGERPANALRTSIMQEYDEMTRTANSNATKNLNFIRQNMDYLTPEEIEYVSKSGDNPDLANELIRRIGIRQSQNQSIQNAKQNLELEAASEKSRVTSATRTARAIAGSITKHKIIEHQSNINDMLRDIDAGVVSGEEVTTLVNSLMDSLRNDLVSTFVADPNFDWGAETNGGLDGIIEEQMDFIRYAVEGLVDGSEEDRSRGRFMLEAQKLSESMGLRDIVRKRPELNKIIPLLKELGPEGSTAVLLNPRVRDVMSSVGGLLLQGDNVPLHEAAKNISNAEIGVEEQTAAIETFVESGLAIAKNPAVSGTRRTQVFTRTYSTDGDTVWQNLDPSAHMAFYNRMVNSEALKLAKELGPAAEDAYIKFAANSMSKVADLRSMVAKINQDAERRDIIWNWDESSDQFVMTTSDQYETDAQGITKPVSIASLVDFNLRRRSNVSEADATSNRINDFIRSFSRGTGIEGDNLRDVIFTGLGVEADKLGSRGEYQGFWKIAENYWVKATEESKEKTSDMFRTALRSLIPIGPVETRVQEAVTTVETPATNRPYETLFDYSSPEEYGETRPITSMTIGELKEFTNPSGAYGQAVKEKIGRVATPLGRYQIVGSTLKSLAKQMNLSDDTVFNSSVQDRMFNQLLKNNGVDKVKSGEMSPDQFIKNLSKVWEGFKYNPEVQAELRTYLRHLQASN